MIEPKEEPLDDFTSAPPGNETSNHPTDFKKEPKVEPLELFHPCSIENEANDNVCNEEETLEDEEIPAHFDVDEFDLFPYANANLLPNHLKDHTYAKSGIFVSRRRGPNKKNDTDLKCPECEYRTRSLQLWVFHLKKKHSTTARLAGLALLCDCGHESYSERHSKTCNFTNTTIIRKSSGPIGRQNYVKPNPTIQCVLCDMYPSTIRGYMMHLHNHHNSTLKANDIYLKCSCDFEVRNSSRLVNDHFKECDSREFTLHKLDREKLCVAKTTPQCILCDAYPSSILAFIRHLHIHHNSTLRKSGILLKCGCGFEYHSECRAHDEWCDDREFSLHKLDVELLDEREAPQCVLCDAHPSTIIGYICHLRVYHNTTLKMNGVYLKCKCGYEGRSDSISVRDHSKRCERQEISLHKLDEE